MGTQTSRHYKRSSPLMETCLGDSSFSLEQGGGGHPTQRIQPDNKLVIISFLVFNEKECFSFLNRSCIQGGQKMASAL